MRDTASFRRTAAAVGLVTTAALSAVSVVLQPEVSEDYAARLAAIDAAGIQGQISAATFLVAQLPPIAALLGTLALLTWPSPLSAWSTRGSTTDLNPSIG